MFYIIMAVFLFIVWFNSIYEDYNKTQDVKKYLREKIDKTEKKMEQIECKLKELEDRSNSER